MGTTKKGILGNFYGKVGTVIGSKWKGIKYMRSLPDPSSKPPTNRQLNQREKFRQATAFLQPLGPVLRIGFRTQQQKQTPINAALSDLLINAMEGEAPAFAINYERLKIAKGNLTGARDASTNLEDSSINFSWHDNSGEGDAHAEDDALVVAVSDTAAPLMAIGAVSRSNAAASLTVPQGTSGSIFHCYLAFAGTGERTQVSNSNYLGTVEIP
ncbi:DUF6266 family protein [Marinilabilia salmonicolor]|uniref:DUF6266 family protein n=1 Tax=Marinilabilia salmonicolor TaxID=989 RepID=UPI000299D8CC|nr:DUF6266 family protein [Marinilabilia salmonicolor]